MCVRCVCRLGAVWRFHVSSRPRRLIPTGCAQPSPRVRAPRFRAMAHASLRLGADHPVFIPISLGDCDGFRAVGLWEIRQLVAVLTDRPLAKFFKEGCGQRQVSRLEVVQTIAARLTPGAPCVYKCSRKQALSLGLPGAAAHPQEAAGSAAFVLGLLAMPHVILNATAVRAQSLRTLQALMSEVWRGDAVLDTLQPGLPPLPVQDGVLRYSARHLGDPLFQEVFAVMAAEDRPYFPSGGMPCVDVAQLFLLCALSVDSPRTSVRLKEFACYLCEAWCHQMGQFVRRKIEDPTPVSMADLLRCCLVGATGKRRRLDPGVYARLSSQHNIYQAALASSCFVFWRLSCAS